MRKKPGSSVFLTSLFLTTVMDIILIKWIEIIKSLIHFPGNGYYNTQNLLLDIIKQKLHNPENDISFCLQRIYRYSYQRKIV